MAWRIILLLGIDLMKQREHNQGKNPVGRATLWQLGADFKQGKEVIFQEKIE
jgi:hypothetical protein